MEFAVIQTVMVRQQDWKFLISAHHTNSGDKKHLWAQCSAIEEVWSYIKQK